MSVSIDSAEIIQRAAVIKRFKTLLTQQRDRFKSYLDLLEKQKDSIESGSTEKLLNYAEIEEKIVADIFSIQKVIDPLEEMYYKVIENQSPAFAAQLPAITLKSEVTPDVSGLKASLERLQSEVIILSTKNKELLSKKMTELRNEIQSLRNNPYNANSNRSTYSNSITASMIDLQG